ncbi:hypothetical protein ACFPTR_13765 [Aliibacillus thermotolerans]|uniref:DUF1700 domain-containing protein n=1 Tax=Aliibacillus thermotolerans TaxID=1834418 RepID=A0ABW0UAL5_9BACI|nr:hypothetical protein [Aliibacillus thermotolerans]MDA3130860.1 hypothetical protein [Aliibacillus thermotolerans]
MNSEEFKAKFKKYRMGMLTVEEEEQFEDELEKLDEYQAFLEVETAGISSGDEYSLETERKILRRSQLSAYFRMGLISIVVSLLLLPTLNLFAMAFDIFP